jgi:predicted PurR-regulated permease PerM
LSSGSGRAPADLRRLSDIVWRVAVLVLAGVVVGAVLWRLRAIVFPVFVALLVCTVLTPPVVAMERRGLKTLLAAWAVFLAALGLIAVTLFLIVPPTLDQVEAVGSAVADGTDDIERWLVEGPLSLERDDVRRYTRDPVARVQDLVADSSTSVLAGARTAAEVAIGTVLALVLTFLLLKDGRRLQRSALELIPVQHRSLARASARRTWDALGGFLRGAATLGAVEGVIIGATMFVVGAPLALAVAVLTFIGAFFPIVGAVVAGAVAVLVTLASGGVAPALVVLAVAVVVQQLDNDLLAPMIYGHSLHLHPVAVLLALSIGASLGGIIGAFVAVPLAASVWGVAAEVRERRRAEHEPVGDGGSSADRELEQRDVVIEPLGTEAGEQVVERQGTLGATQQLQQP